MTSNTPRLVRKALLLLLALGLLALASPAGVNQPAVASGCEPMVCPWGMHWAPWTCQCECDCPETGCSICN